MTDTPSKFYKFYKTMQQIWATEKEELTSKIGYMQDRIEVLREMRDEAMDEAEERAKSQMQKAMADVRKENQELRQKLEEIKTEMYTSKDAAQRLLKGPKAYNDTGFNQQYDLQVVADAFLCLFDHFEKQE